MAGYHVAFTAAAVMLGTGAILMGAVLLRRRHLEGIEFDPAAVPASRVMALGTPTQSPAGGGAVGGGLVSRCTSQSAGRLLPANRTTLVKYGSGGGIPTPTRELRSHQRADAARNRVRLLQAAGGDDSAERGVEVGVGEIAEA